MSVRLLRHSRPDRVEGLCYGVSEVPLAADFDQQVKRLRAELCLEGMIVVSSPLSRCLKLASALAEVVHLDARLRELDFGLWEGRAWDSLSREELDSWCADPVRRSPPQGESFQTLQMRAVAALGDAVLLADGADLLLCTHAGVIRALLAYVHGLSLEQALDLPVPYAQILELESWRQSSGSAGAWAKALGASR